MKCVFYSGHGGLEVIEYGDRPEGQIRGDEVRVQVKFAALNHIDIFVRKGWPGLKLNFPHIPGSDGSGIVVETGELITDLSLGDEVFFSPGTSCGVCESCLLGSDHNHCRNYSILGEHRFGTFAEFIQVKRANILKKPTSLSFETAAAFPLTFLTAWQMVVEKGRVKPGDWVLVLAAGSGVGVAAIQIAKLLGARVIAAAGTEKKLEKARELGAEATINYKEENFVDACRKITQKSGVEVVIENPGAETLEKSLMCAKWGGKVVICGATSGFETKIDLRMIFYKQIELLGSTMASKGDLFRITDLVEQGKLKPVISEIFPLKEFSKAQEKMSQREVCGKILLAVS